MNVNASAALAFQAQEVMSVVKTSTGATASVKYVAMNAANQSVYAMRAVEVGKASIANVVKTRSFTPWGVGFAVAITAAGYFLDSETGDVYLPGNDLDSRPPPVGYVYLANPGYNANQSTYSSTPYGAARKYIEQFNFVEQCFNYTGSAPPPYYAQFDRRTSFTNGKCIGGESGIKVGITTEPANYVPDSPYTDDLTHVTNDQIYDVASNFDYAEWQKIFIDPLSGQANREIPEFQDAGTEISDDYAEQQALDPSKPPTILPSKDGKPAVTVGTEEPPPQDPCIKNPSLLMCAELDDVPDATEIQTQEIDVSYSPVSFSSNASCPADLQGPYGSKFSFDAPCQLATGINPFVILFSMLGAIFIISGSRAES